MSYRPPRDAPLDGALGDEPGIAWVSAVTSVVLATGSGLFYRYARAPR